MRKIATIFLFVILALTSARGEETSDIQALKTRIGYNLMEGDTGALQKDLQNLLDIVSLKYTTESSEYAETLLWCAMILEEAGDNRQSQKVLGRSDKIFKKVGKGRFNGRDTLQQIFRYDLMSALEENGFRDGMAVKNAQKALALKKDYFGEKSEEYLNGLLELSRLYAKQLNYKKSTSLHNQAFDSYVTLLSDKFCELSEFDREDFWDVAIKYINKTLSLADKNSRKTKNKSDNQLASAAYNALLLSKGLMLNTSVEFEQFIENRGNEEAKRLLDKKRHLRKEGASRQVLDSLDLAILNQLEISGNKFEIPTLDIKWEDIRNALGKDDLAIEFYTTDTDEYGAVLVKKDSESPVLVNLPSSVLFEGKEYPLSMALSSYNGKLLGAEDFGEFQSAVADAVWTDEILTFFPVQDNGKVYFSCDGLLQLVGVEYFPLKSQGMSPINDIYNMNRLSSTRVLATPKVKVSQGEDAALFGGLTYNMTQKSMETEHAKYPNVGRSGFSNEVFEREGSESQIPPLEKTLEEVKEISGILSEDNITPALYHGREGIEEVIKSMSGQSPSILHIATHGFYIPREEISDNGERFLWLTLTDTTASDNPLKRTGLLMSGAHKAYINRTPVEDVEDGILSAYEISHLDLGGSDLVVLSACETGLGDLTSDGVAGLQRGFKKAASNSLIMSLWKVDDEATYQLMVNFYRHWIEEGLNKSEALRAAQNDLRNNSSHPEWKSPKYWASFILLDGVKIPN